MMMKNYKNKFGEIKFKDKEMWCNVKASVIAGMMATIVSNPLECITVNK